MKISDVREELQDYLHEVNKTNIPPWIVEALDSWCRSVFMGVTKFKYWDENKNKNEVPVTLDVLKELISPYREFNKFKTWLDRNFEK
jgi:exo-beta-1,3-glucanase (GH17 family)